MVGDGCPAPSGWEAGRPAGELAYRSMGVVAHGGHAYCCACGRRSRFFLPYGGRAGAMCPRCGALERHRFLVLHVPGQPGSTMEVGVYRGFMRALVESRGGTYVGVDVVPGPDVDRVADVTALPFGDDEFDTVICSHVLEHVQDDRSALHELARVVKPSGTCLIMFPHDESRTTTFEDDATGSAAERRRLNGQSDHVRIYGRDRVARLTDTFDTRNVESDDGAEWLYLCRRRAPAG